MAEPTSDKQMETFFKEVSQIKASRVIWCCCCWQQQFISPPYCHASSWSTRQNRNPAKYSRIGILQACAYLPGPFLIPNYSLARILLPHFSRVCRCLCPVIQLQECPHLIGSAHMQELLATIRAKQRKLEELHEQSKTVTQSGKMHELREAMQAETDEVSRLAHQVKTRLEALDKNNAAALKRKVLISPYLCP